MSTGINIPLRDLRSIRLFLCITSIVLISLGCRDSDSMHEDPKVVDKKTFFLNDRLEVAVASFAVSNREDIDQMLLGDISDPEIYKNNSLHGLTFIAPGREVDPKRDYKDGVIDGRLDVDIVRILYIKPWNSVEHQLATNASKNAKIQWENLKSWNDALKEKNAETIYGMECLRDSKKVRGWRRVDCLAQRKSNEWMLIRFSEIYEGGAPNPIMHAQYYSEAYGGVEVSWISSSWNLHQWKSIDQKLWKLVDQSNKIK